MAKLLEEFVDSDLFDLEFETNEAPDLEVFNNLTVLEKSNTEINTFDRLGESSVPISSCILK